MIYFLYGPNSYEREHGLATLVAGLAAKHPGVVPERLDGADVEPHVLPDLLQGTSLFNERRIIVLRSPSAHKALWTALDDYLGKVSDTTDLVITDGAPDKRTRTFKSLSDAAQAREYAEFGPRGTGAMVAWATAEAAARGLGLPRQSAELLIDRVGYDQWALAGAIDKLALVGDASPARIRDLVEASPSANAFELFEHALRGDAATVRAMLADLEQTQDPHALLGLLGTQGYGLALVANSSRTPVELGKLIGSSPYPLQKMTPLARRLTKAQVTRAVAALAECDRDFKRSAGPPWTLLSRALLKISALQEA